MKTCPKCKTENAIFGKYSSQKNELEILERYMLAMADQMQKANKRNEKIDRSELIEIPYWHEVKATPKAFPTRKERG